MKEIQLMNVNIAALTFGMRKELIRSVKKKRHGFTLCCGHGKIKLPNPKDPPTVLKELLFG
ncbi:hypothetical protein H5410_021175 [Solanum commersonii]|uniref:Uncharacterized protein n=1 Tax=Solanum commersonii TaxID=4109 RepID=A0A9J5ZGE0_SOLCO|nr:hypothetical protein H5410_021175 [Solanum commersonii]